MPRYAVERPHDLGALLAGLREEQGLTQEALSERLGFGRTYLSELEAGHTTVQLARLFRALNALGAQMEIVVPSLPRENDDE